LPCALMLCHEADFASVSTGTGDIHSLSARTLCSDWDANMDHRSGLIGLKQKEPDSYNTVFRLGRNYGS